MSNYSWGVDGLGNQHIIHKSNDRVIIACCLGHSAKACIEILTKQGTQNDRKTDSSRNRGA